MRDFRLAIVGVTAALIRVIADVVGVEGVQKAIWTVVQGEAEHREVVGVHHAMTEAHGLPLRHQPRTAFHNDAQPGGVALRVFEQFRKMLFDHLIGERRQCLVATLVVEELELSEAHVAGRDAADHGGGFDGLASQRQAGADQAERTGAGDAQMMQRAAGEVFADAGSQHRAPVGKT